MYYDVCIMTDEVFATCDWPEVCIHACIKKGVSGWAKIGQDTTPFNDYSKATQSLYLMSTATTLLTCP